MPPVPTRDLPFLETGAPEVDERECEISPDLVIRDCAFDVRLATDAPGTFTGWMTINDPWQEDRQHRLPVLGEADRPIQVSPSRLRLEIPGSDADQGAGSARLLVRSPYPAADLRIEAEEDAPIRIERSGTPSERSSLFQVTATKEALPGSYQLVVHASSHTDDRTRVPVSITE